MRKIALAALALLFCTTAAFAQAVGGSASISVTSSSARVALPANKSSYPSVLITPTPDTTQEVFYALGDVTVAAVTTGPALPGGGICVNAGPNTYVAAITATGTATVRITQLTTCPIFARAGSSGGTPGSGTVTSVGLSLPSIFVVTGSPVTTAGTLAATLNTQAANLIWAGPTTGVAAAPTFRSLVTADLPALACANLSDASAFCNGTNASGLTGTVASARISGAYGGITGVGTLASGAVPTTLLTGALQAAQFPALTGDITTSAGTLATTLKNTGPGVTGPLGSATVAPIVTIDAQGRVTALSSATITPAVGSITGLGANVATALGVSVGSAGAFITFNGNAGTPSALVGTNITGTASGLTAGNVTTNANLTGDVTSVGNATTLTTTQPGAHTWQVTQTFTPAANTNAIASTGYSVTGSGTTALMDLAGTWNTSGVATGIKMNLTGTAFGAASKYIDLQVGGSTVFAVGSNPAGANLLTFSSLWLYPNATPTTNNAVLSSSGAGSVILNAPSAGTLFFRVNNSSYAAVSSTVVGFAAAQQVGFSSTTDPSAALDTILTRAGAAIWQHGAANAASVVNQTITAQGSRVGTDTNTVGANLTIKPGVSTGNVTSSALNFNSWVAVASGSATQTDTLTMQITAGIVSIPVATDATTSTGGVLQVAGGASVAKRFWIPAITASSGLQTAVLCQSSGGEMIADSVACLASGAQFKTILGPMEDGALGRLMALPIERWRYNAEGNFRDANWTRERIGPIAQDVALLDTRLIGYDKDGSIRTYSTDQLLAFTIKAVQELNAKVDRMQIKPASAN